MRTHTHYSALFSLCVDERRGTHRNCEGRREEIWNLVQRKRSGLHRSGISSVACSCTQIYTQIKSIHLCCAVCVCVPLWSRLPRWRWKSPGWQRSGKFSPTSSNCNKVSVAACLYQTFGFSLFTRGLAVCEDCWARSKYQIFWHEGGAEVGLLCGGFGSHLCPLSLFLFLSDEAPSLPLSDSLLSDRWLSLHGVPPIILPVGV